MKLAAIYGRYSTDKQSATSIDDQVRKCREFAASHGLTVLEAHVYADEAISGSGSDRPSLMDLLAAAGRSPRPFDVLLLDDTSRLSRNMGDQFRIFERLNYLGVRIVSVSQGVDTDDEQAGVLMAVHGLVDSLYVRELAKKVHRGLEGLALRGLSTGGRCFGYDTVAVDSGSSRRLVVNESEAAIVRRIFEACAAGDSLKRITFALNREQVPSPRPRIGRNYATWAPSCIREILRRELYAGVVIWNRSKWIKTPGTNRRVRRERPRAEWQVQSRPELRIISDDLWQSVAQRLAFVQERFGVGGRRNGLLSRTASSPYLFSGILKCGMCGANLIIVTGRAKGRDPMYGCSQKWNRGACENDLRESHDLVERRLLSELQNAVLRPEKIERAIVQFGQQLQAALSGISAGLSDARKKKADLERETARLAQAIAQSGPTPALIAAIGEREAQLRQLTEQLLSEGAGSVESQVDDLRRFVTANVFDLQKLLAREPSRAKLELSKHLNRVAMLPCEDAGDRFYEAVGNWSLTGAGPETGRALQPVGMERSDGCGDWI